MKRTSYFPLSKMLKLLTMKLSPGTNVDISLQSFFGMRSHFSTGIEEVTCIQRKIIIIKITLCIHCLIKVEICNTERKKKHLKDADVRKNSF
jgi:hypothetical protein